MNSDYVRMMSDLLKIVAASDTSPLAEGYRKRLEDARRVDLDSATVVIASWENRFAAAGGVRAVTHEYAKYLTSKERKVRVVTPLHIGLATPPGALQLASVLWFDFEGARRRVEVFESEWEGVKWIYIHCDSFFLADGGRDHSNPYLYEDDDRGQSLANQSPLLVRDCLFYAAVVPKVLAALRITDNVILHLQDWETVGVALTMKSAILRKEIDRAISVLVLHNPYDKSLGSAGWAKLTPWPEPTDTPPTFLGRMLPFVDAPPATVSVEFAKDLVADKLQTEHLADHLQGQFRRLKIVGVDNGPFETVEPPFTPEAIAGARHGRPGAILSEKKKLREAMTRKMAEHRPAGRWGDVDFAQLRDDVPVFMCVGRLDPGQKGFDVAARALENVLKSGVDARFVLAPIVGNAPQPFVDDLRALAVDKDLLGKVVVYPFRMQVGYFETQAGCTFSIWPSMYEPFGGVSEFLLRGTPVIARSTGGLRQQIRNYDPATGEGNGILYGTKDPDPESEEWRKIRPSPYTNEWRVIQEGIPERRMKYAVYIDQVEQLAKAIHMAVKTFNDNDAYGRLLSNAPGSVAGYTWQRAAGEYAALYGVARQ